MAYSNYTVKCSNCKHSRILHCNSTQSAWELMGSQCSECLKGKLKVKKIISENYTLIEK